MISVNMSEESKMEDSSVVIVKAVSFTPVPLSWGLTYNGDGEAVEELENYIGVTGRISEKIFTVSSKLSEEDSKYKEHTFLSEKDFNNHAIGPEDRVVREYKVITEDGEEHFLNADDCVIVEDEELKERICKNTTFNIVDGVYKGPRVWAGDLDLHGSGATDLGDLEVVEGSISLAGCKVTSLKNLKAANSISATNSRLQDIGKLEECRVIHFYPNEKVISNLYKEVGADDFEKASIERKYLFKDIDELRKEIEDFKKNNSLEDLPLSINHPNIIIRNYVNSALEGAK
jgi:hypothetical protein